jgi:hypothetical protein
MVVLRVAASERGRVVLVPVVVLHVAVQIGRRVVIG